MSKSFYLKIIFITVVFSVLILPTKINAQVNYSLSVSPSSGPAQQGTSISATVWSNYIPRNGFETTPAPAASGTLSCGTVTTNSIVVNYSFSNGTNVSLFRGTTLLRTFGSGSGSGSHTDSGLASDTSHTYNLRNGTSTASPLLASTTCRTSAPAPAASGTLTCGTVTTNSIVVNYSFSNGTNVSLFRGTTLLRTFGSGSGSGSHTDSGLASDTSHTYNLRNGTSTASPLLASTTCRTSAPAPAASGTLTCGTVTTNSIVVNYSFSNGTNVSLFRGTTLLRTFGSGSGSGSHTDSGLASDTSHTYNLRNGTSTASPLLASTTCRTSAPAAFNFSVSVSPSSGSVTQGSSVATAVTASLTSGTTQSVSFSASGLPSGVTTSFSPNPCSPTCSSTLTFTASSTATTGGPHTITITGTGGGLIRTTTYSLTVTAAPAASGTLSCGTVTTNSIVVNYSFSNGTNVSLFRGTTLLTTFGSGLGSGSHTDSGLASNTSYTYNLRNGTLTTSTLLASTTCKTSAPAAFNFSVSVSPTSGSVTQGSSVATTVTASLTSGATQSVSFSASGLPSGVTTSFSRISCNPTCSSTLTFTATLTATTGGPHTITITGTGGGLTRTTTYSLTVSRIATGLCVVPGQPCSSLGPRWDSCRFFPTPDDTFDCCERITDETRECSNGPNNQNSNGCGQSCHSLCTSDFVPSANQATCISETRSAWSRFRVTKTTIERRYRDSRHVCKQALSYTFTYIKIKDVCSTADKFDSANPPVMRPGRCVCGTWGSPYKVCCRLGADGRYSPVNASQHNIDPFLPPEAFCPAGSRTFGPFITSCPKLLTVTRTGTGSGTVTGPGINCGTDCSENYSYLAGSDANPSGSPQTISLTASVASGSVFAGWSGACSGTGTCTVTMNAHKTVTAIFNLIDNTKPTSSITSPANNSWQRANFSVAVTDSDTGGSGLSTCYYRVWDSIAGMTVSQAARTCNSSFTVTVGSGANCRTQGIGTCSVRAWAVDRAGNSNLEAGSSAIALHIDYTTPTVGSITPTSTTVNTSTTFSSSVSDNMQVTSCSLHVGGINQGSMTLSLSPCVSCTASRSHTFTSTGTFTMSALCSDLAGNSTTGPSTTITVTAACTRTNPTVSLSPASQTGNPGDLKQYTFSVTNNDSSACGSSPFSLTIQACPAGWTCSLNNSSVTISPGATNAATTLSVTSPLTALSGTYTVTTRATNSNATSFFADASATYVIAPVPTCSISANPTTITSGQSSTLTWSSTNATTCSILGIGSVSTSGSRSVSPTSTTTYTFTCSGAGGNCSDSATVTVTTPAPTCSISANPTTITSGQSSTLTWSSTNATTCSILGIGSVSTSGSRSVSPTSTTTYTFTCSGAGGGNCSASATVTVTAAFDFSLSVSPSSGSVTQGGSTATTLTVRLESGATQSVGSFSCSGLPSGAFCSFVPTSCNPTCTSIVILATASTSPAGTYLVTISGIGGGLTKQTTYSLTVTVANQPPSAINLSVTQPNYCVSGPAGIFSWTFTDPDAGDRQSAYQVQVDNNSNFSSPEADSGKVNSNSNSFATLPGQLRYNTTYYWRLKVWDSKNVSSVWISGPSFTTPLHAYPTIDFSWLPPSPSVNEEVQFTDRSTVHGGSTKVSWSWTFQDGNPATSFLPNPRTKFTSTGAKIVSLRVFDSTGYSCLGSKTVNLLLPLPEYREVPPR